MKRHDNLRINIFFVFVLLISSLILYRLFVLCYLKHDYYSQAAKAQNENISNILARGSIYFEDPQKQSGSQNSGDNLFLAATNKKFPVAYIVPTLIDNSKAEDISQKLADILKIDQSGILNLINSQSNLSKVLARRLDNDQVSAIKNLGIKGVGISYEIDRFYPAETLGANVLGFLGYGESGRAGQYGIEAFYDNELFGKENQTVSGDASKGDAVGFFDKITSLFFKKTGTSANSDNTTNRPVDLALTIDKNIQTLIENKLDELIKKWSAEGGTIIVQEPSTGAILAMADRPNFNPNSYGSSKADNFLNRSTQEIFEPGSSFKPITMAAGLDLAKVTPQTKFTDVGYVNIAGYTIKNFSERVFGTQTMSQVLEKSINTGAMFVENLVGDDNFLNYVINAGFGQRTGIDLPGELNGNVANLYSGRKINYLTASFGQGIAVTSLQLINAYSMIANGGKLMRPYLVEKIIKEGGEEIITKPEIISIPISEKTADKLKSMLVSVVDNGFDKARIKGYDIAGKTGTAQIPDGKGGYLEKEFIHDFLGFAPAYNAKFTVLIKMDKPKGITFAADSLSPTYREIASFLLNYYNIPPTR